MITVTGSLAFDHIMDFPGKFSDHIMPDKIHQINLSFLVNTLQKQKGGTAGNIAYTLALLKSPVSILGVVGSDFVEYEKFLKDSGVDTSNIKVVEGESSSSAFIMTDLSDNQLAAFYPGAMKQANSLSLEGLQTDFVIISSNSPDTIVKLTKQAQKLNLPYMLDVGMQLPSLNSENLSQIIPSSTVLIGNDYEISLLCDKAQVTSNKLLEQVKILITTLGEKGSLIQTKSETIEVKAGKPDQVLDPTGAGDAYRAGFLTGYLKNLDLKTCGQMGSIAACYAIEKYGTTNHSFTIPEFWKRYRENFGTELKL